MEVKANGKAHNDNMFLICNVQAHKQRREKQQEGIANAKDIVL